MKKIIVYSCLILLTRCVMQKPTKLTKLNEMAKELSEKVKPYQIILYWKVPDRILENSKTKELILVYIFPIKQFRKKIDEPKPFPITKFINPIFPGKYKRYMYVFFWIKNNKITRIKWEEL